MDISLQTLLWSFQSNLTATLFFKFLKPKVLALTLSPFFLNLSHAPFPVPQQTSLDLPSTYIQNATAPPPIALSTPLFGHI